MRLVRLVILIVVVVAVGWLIFRTVSVQSTDDQVNITIDKGKLRDAGHDAAEEARDVAKKAGHLLERSGEKIKEKASEPENP